MWSPGCHSLLLICQSSLEPRPQPRSWVSDYKDLVFLYNLQDSPNHKVIFLPVVVGIAGGLTNLSKMPACNLMLLGTQKRTLSGFSSTAVLPHTGYIYHCDVVQTLPPVSAPHLALCSQELCLTVALPKLTRVIPVL